jgi:uroporphyrinogen III methyltransferase/synthase
MSKAYLVGAGPGNPELITVRGLHLLQSADCVLYDNLAPSSLLSHAPPHAERIYVGKKRSQHAFTQEEIVEMMIDRVRRGLNVVRLKGGDPFIFGRGGEEVEGLASAGVSYEVVPGVTTPLGIAAYTGVPLTHREHTSVVTFVTGHDVAAIDWSRFGLSETLVIFMGFEHLDLIVDRLVAAGRSPQTPAMAVRWATRPDQSTVCSELAALPARVREERLTPPATLIIGDVVGLRDRLSWYERLPLFGRRIVVTRSGGQADGMLRLLRELGADPVHLPVIEMAPLDDYGALDDCIRRLGEYDWIVFTSANTVEFFFGRLAALNRDARSIRGSICTIGPATAEVLRAMHLIVDLMPEEHTSEGVAAAFSDREMAGKRVLLPRAATARDVIPDALTALGAHVDVADTYRNIIPPDAATRIANFLSSGRRLDWITFTSGSTVKNWLTLAGRESLQGVRIASIGPATSEVLRKHNLPIHAEASPSTMEALVEAILNSETK